MKGGDRRVINLDSCNETYVSQFVARGVGAQFHVDRLHLTRHSKERRVR